MFRPLILAFALIATPAAAQHYQAQAVTQPDQARIIARDIMWTCGGTGCTAPENHSRPAIVCALLVKQVGALASFTVAGKPISASDLEKCNARAR